MERLTVKNLGPLKDFTLETNRLTVIIGPQASGKSLLAQMLFFFKEFRTWIADEFPPLKRKDGWMEDAVNLFLSALRGVSIGSFVEGKTNISYSKDDDEYGIDFDWEYKNKNMHTRCFRVVLNDEFAKHLDDSVVRISERHKELLESDASRQVYIPTERSLYTRLVDVKRSVLYSDRMPYTMKKFADMIDYCGTYGGFVSFIIGDTPLASLGTDQIFRRVAEQQRKALGGEIKLSVGGLPVRQFWTWSIEGKEEDRFPLEGISSGQMETWPFFVLAAVFGSKKEPHDFYFEEPETHLHPRAQVEVIRTIAYLISLGHRFVITTHSPFILYIINTLIQAHIAYDGAVPEGEFSIDPGHVAAYSLGEKAGSIVNPETKLLDLTEIDSVFDEINVSFGKYMDMEFAKHEK